YDRARELHPGLRALYMSGYSENEISRHGVLEPGVCLLAKPFTVRSLTARVNEVLDAGGSAGAAAGDD
ncbi:MAG: hypothetical protein JW781_04315, partial [Deltaproteobacteria bacterium]|nr:hypothetical protein [Candidatus Anaeroferrophillacea bacterium]